MTPGARRRDGRQLAMTQTDSGLVRELDCVGSLVLVRSGRGHPRGFFSKKELGLCARTSGAQEPCTHNCCTQLPRTATGCGHDLLPLRVPHGLIKRGQQELKEEAEPRETSYHRETELMCRDLAHSDQANNGWGGGQCDCSH